MKRRLAISFLFLFLLSSLGSLYIIVYHPLIKVQKSQNITDKASLHLERAQILNYQKKYNKSIEEYQKVLKENSDSIEAKIGLANNYLALKKYEEASSILKKIPIREQNDKTKMLIADIYIAIKKYDEAESLLREQLEKFPNDNANKLKLAELLSWEKRYQESKALFQQILIDNPEDVQVKRKYALLLIWMGELDEGTKKLKETLTNKNK